jgi:hypothetical protein
MRLIRNEPGVGDLPLIHWTRCEAFAADAHIDINRMEAVLAETSPQLRAIPKV